jgi:hypothetical protein
LQLIVAEEAANRALYQLEQARARITAVEAEARVMEQYRDLGSCSQWEIIKNNVCVSGFWFLYCHSQYSHEPLKFFLLVDFFLVFSQLIKNKTKIYYRFFGSKIK